MQRPLEATLLPREVDVDGVTSPDGQVRYIGKATRQPDGTWRCLADVKGQLCLVEVTVRNTESGVKL